MRKKAIALKNPLGDSFYLQRLASRGGLDYSSLKGVHQSGVKALRSMASRGLLEISVSDPYRDPEASLEEGMVSPRTLSQVREDY